MGWIEIMKERERRRFWSDDQNLSILSEVSAGTESVADIARRHDIVPQQIYGWRRQFGVRDLNRSHRLKRLSCP